MDPRSNSVFVMEIPKILDSEPAVFRGFTGIVDPTFVKKCMHEANDAQKNVWKYNWKTFDAEHVLETRKDIPTYIQLL